MTLQSIANKQKVSRQAIWLKTPKGRAYKNTPKYKAYKRAYKNTPKYKAYKRAYKNTPKYKAYQRAYQNTPKYKAYQRAYYLRVVKPKRDK